MAGILHIDPAAEAALQNYPPEKDFVRWGTTGSLGAHLLFISIVLLLAYLNHIKSLRDLMSGTIAQPAPANEIEIILPPDDEPPPPVAHPEFVKQIIVPVVPPPPPPIIKPKPKPVVHAPLIQHIAKPVPKASSRMVMGTGHLPVPDYPMEARRMRVQGTTVVSVTFDGSGRASAVEVTASSGSGLLDNSTRHFILENWREPDLAGETRSQPVQYVLPH